MKTIEERNLKHLNVDEKQKHLDNWSNFRIVAMNEAENLFGKMNKNNLKDIQNYMKIETKKWKCGLRN